MLLDTLGVPPSAFVDLQDKALKEVQDALTDAASSAHLMRTWQLGKAYHLPQILDRIERYGLQDLHNDPFIRRLLSHTLYHVKREIKYHARIPGESNEQPLIE
jgi:RNA-dependent RNA polymerase